MKRIVSLVFLLFAAWACSDADDVTRQPDAPALLEQPVALAAALSDEGALNLTWTDRSEGESGYKVLKSIDGAAFRLVVVLPENAASYRDPVVEAGHVYAYRVFAFTPQAEGAYAEVEYTAPVDQGPKAFAPTAVIRAIKVPKTDTQAIRSKEGLRKVVGDCLEIGINAIVLCAWTDTYTLFPSQVAKEYFGVEIDPQFAGRDIFAELLELTEGTGIKVFLWMEYGLAAKWGDPDTGGRLLAQRPEWGLKGQDGKLITKNGFQWLDGFNPQVQEFMTKLICEAITKYKVDGVACCDRLPAAPVEGGYNQYLVDAYFDETGEAVVPAPKDARWAQWRADRLSKFQAELFDAMKAVRPDIIALNSPSIYNWSKVEYLQDWEQWIKNGKVNYIVPQVYRWGISSYSAELKNNFVGREFLDRLGDKYERFAPAIAVRSGNTYQPDGDLERIIDLNRQLGIRGEALFHYGAFESRPELKQVVKSCYDKDPLPRIK